MYYIRMQSLLHSTPLSTDSSLEFSVPPPSLEFSVLSSFPPPLTVEFVAPCFSHRISQSKTQITALLSFLHDSPHTWIFWYGGNDPACVSLCASEIRRADLYFRGKRGNAKRPLCARLGLQKNYGCNFVCVQTIRQKRPQEINAFILRSRSGRVLPRTMKPFLSSPVWLEFL